MISVVVTTHDRPRFLAEQLHALAGQDFTGAWEVVIALDGIVPEGTATVSSFHGKIPGLRVIHASARRGEAHARNQVAEATSGEQIAFCDGNDVVVPGWLSALSRILQTHEIAAGPIILRDINPEWSLATRPWLARLETGLAHDEFLPWSSAANLAVRRCLHERISGFDETLRLQSDRDYCWRASMAGARLVFVPEARAHHRLHTHLGDAFRYARGRAADAAALHAKFARFGMKPDVGSEFARLTLRRLPRLLLREMPAARGDRTRMAACMTELGLRVGSLLGSIRTRRGGHA